MNINRQELRDNLRQRIRECIMLDMSNSDIFQTIQSEGWRLKGRLVESGYIQGERHACNEEFAKSSGKEGRIEVGARINSMYVAAAAISVDKADAKGLTGAAQGLAKLHGFDKIQVEVSDGIDPALKADRVSAQARLLEAMAMDKLDDAALQAAVDEVNKAKEEGDTK